MAENDEIIANCEAIDEIITTFNSSLEAYLKTMKTDYDALQNQTSELLSAWSGTMSKNFSDQMQSQMDIIRSSLEKGGTLNKYLDETAAEIREALDQLRAASKEEG